MSPFTLAGRSRVVIMALIVTTGSSLAIVAGCHTGSEGNGPLSKTPETAAMYVGNAACAECHRNECEHQGDTNHAHSLRHASLRSLGALAPPIGPIAGTDYSIRQQGDNLQLVRSDQPEVGATLQFAFGAGTSVMTYVGEIGADRLTELRMSYSPVQKRWYTTPGQENYADLKLGHVQELGMATRCVLCHADRLSSASNAPAEGSLGIGCESCHGAGSAHVAAAKVPHATDLKIEKMGEWGASRINAMCGRCHRTLKDVALVGNDAANTARFQGFGLSLSPCFKKSSDKLSCITCHDPHTDAGADTRHYESICLSCHSRTGPARSFSFPIEAEQRKACPVNARDHCIGCHMPKRAIMPGTKIPIAIADHLIWSYTPQR